MFLLNSFPVNSFLLGSSPSVKYLTAQLSRQEDEPLDALAIQHKDINRYIVIIGVGYLTEASCQGCNK